MKISYISLSPRWPNHWSEHLGRRFPLHFSSCFVNEISFHVFLWLCPSKTVASNLVSDWYMMPTSATVSRKHYKNEYDGDLRDLHSHSRRNKKRHVWTRHEPYSRNIFAPVSMPDRRRNQSRSTQCRSGDFVIISSIQFNDCDDD